MSTLSTQSISSSTNAIGVYFHSLSANETTYITEASSNLICNFYVNYTNLYWSQTNGSTPTAFQSLIFYKTSASTITSSASISLSGYTVTVDSTLPTISFQTGNYAINPNDPSNVSGATLKNNIVPYGLTSSGTKMYSGQNGTFCLPLVPIPNDVVTNYPTIYVGYLITYPTTVSTMTTYTTNAYYSSVNVYSSSSKNSFTLHVFDNAANSYSLPKIALSSITTNNNYIKSTNFTVGTNGYTGSNSCSAIRRYLTTELNSYGNNLNWASFSATWVLGTTANVTGYILKNPSITNGGTTTKYYGSYFFVTKISSGTFYPGMGFSSGTTYTYAVDIFSFSGTTLVVSGATRFTLSNSTNYVCTLASNSMITAVTTATAKTWTCTLLTAATIASGSITSGAIVASGMSGTTVGTTTWPPMMYPVSISLSGTTPAGTTFTTITKYGVFWNKSATKTTATTVKAYGVVTTPSWYTFNKYWDGATGSTLGVATGNTRFIYANVAPVGSDTAYTSYNHGTGPAGTAGFYTAMTNPPSGTAATPYLYLGTKVNNMTFPGWTGPLAYSIPTIQGGSTGLGTPSAKVTLISNSYPIHPIAYFLPQETTTPYTAPARYINQYPSSPAASCFSFTATATGNGYNGNSYSVPFGVIGWCVDNCPLYIVTNDLMTNAVALEALDIFAAHPESGQLHHHMAVPSVYNWVLDYTPRFLGWYQDGYPLVSPFLVYDTTTGQNRMITSTDLNANNGLVATVKFNLVSPKDGQTYYFQYDFCYVQTYCYPFTLGSFYGTPATVSKLTSC